MQTPTPDFPKTRLLVGPCPRPDCISIAAASKRCAFASFVEFPQRPFPVLTRGSLAHFLAYFPGELFPIGSY